MNCVAKIRDIKITSTNTKDIICWSNGLSFSSLNRVVDAVSTLEAYEDGEHAPTASVILAAASALGHVAEKEVSHVEIEPYFGEVGLIWKNGRNKRVKAIFGPAVQACSVYHEKMVNGRVVEHEIRQNSNSQYLQERLSWLKNEELNVR
jgi:hypothetical protein